MNLVPRRFLGTSTFKHFWSKKRETTFHCHWQQVLCEHLREGALSESLGPRPRRSGRSPRHTSALTYRSSDVAGRSGRSRGSLRSLQRCVRREVRTGRGGGPEATPSALPGTRSSAPRHLPPAVRRASRGAPHPTPRALSGLSSRPVRGSKRHLPACPPHQAAPGLQAPPAHKAACDQNQGDRGPATPAARSLWAHPHSWNSAPVTDATRVAAAGHPAAIRASMSKGADCSRVRSPRPAWLRCRG